MILRKPRPPKKAPHPPAPAEYRDPLPITQPRAAGIDVGDATHRVCVDSTPGGVREFPAHTPGLRDLVGWLRQRGVSTVALEASGAYGHALFLTLVEAGFQTIMTSPAFTRQIKGRPKTDRLDCAPSWPASAIPRCWRSCGIGVARRPNRRSPRRWTAVIGRSI